MSELIDQNGAYIIRLLVATVVAGLIGLEREHKGKPTGIRTNILICLGACMLMILSIETARRAGPPSDPGRIAAQVVTGVGFLGAGAILRYRVRVAGLTSAATIWFIAALGLVIGSGDYVIALTAMVLTIVTLTALNKVERAFEVSRQLHILKMRMPRKKLADVRRAIDDGRIAPDDVGVTHEDHIVTLTVEYVTRQEKHDAFIGELQKIPEVEILFHY